MCVSEHLAHSNEANQKISHYNRVTSSQNAKLKSCINGCDDKRYVPPTALHCLNNYIHANENRYISNVTYLMHEPR